jgi:hypothetical protein
VIELTDIQRQIVLAMLAQMGLAFLIVLLLGPARIIAIRRKQVKRSEDGKPIFPKWATQVSDCFINQFQVPTLFYVACLLTLWLHAETERTVWLAWIFFALRLAHAAVFMTVNIIFVRFSLFLASTVVAISMWLPLLLAVVGA